MTDIIMHQQYGLIKMRHSSNKNIHVIWFSVVITLTDSKAVTVRSSYFSVYYSYHTLILLEMSCFAT